MIGDSHAEAQLAGLLSAVEDKRGAIGFSALVSCAPVLDSSPVPGSRCQAFNSQNLAPMFKPRTVPLILSASWVVYAGGPDLDDAREEASRADFKASFLRSSCALAEAGPTFVVMPTPHFRSSVTRDLQRRVAGDPDAADITTSRAGHEHAQREVLDLLGEAERRCGIRLLDPLPYLCREEICDGSRGHHPLYRDQHHLTPHGARLLAPMFRKVLSTTDAGIQP
jgi:hypothetical protein